jgi:DNA polymerase alpha subunit A
VSAVKRKREEEREKQEKIKNGINKYFSAKTAAAAPKPKVRSATGIDSIQQRQC